MNQVVKNIVIDLITPACLLLLAVFSHPFLPVDSLSSSSTIVYLPFLLIISSFLLCWKFDQLDSMSINLVMVIAYVAVFYATALNNEENLSRTMLSISVLLPLNIIIFKLWPISSTLSLAGIFRISLVCAQGLLVYFAIKIDYAPLFHLMSFKLLPSLSFFSESISQVSLLLFFIAGLIQLLLIALKQRPLDSTLLFILAAFFIAALNTHDGLVYLTAFSIVPIMLNLNTIQASYNMAFIDTLTGLPSRRAMELEIKKLGRRYTFAMLDIDHFKKINDEYGHNVGDQVLRMVAKHIRRIGGGGRPARYGGEEFAIIFPNRTIVDSAPFLEVVRGNVAKDTFALRNKDRPRKTPSTRNSRAKSSNEISVTISIGVAESNRNQKTVSEVMKSADIALYKAKKQGRNRLC